MSAKDFGNGLRGREVMYHTDVSHHLPAEENINWSSSDRSEPVLPITGPLDAKP